MKSFAAIDFETANQHRSSVCSVGVVVVRNGKVTDKLYQLIKPTPNFYTYWCTEVHGMTNADTDDAMDFQKYGQKLHRISRAYHWLPTTVRLTRVA